MTRACWDAFFELHRGLPREGPGEVLDEAEAEAALWRGARHEFGYLLSVVRPR
ncbi:hypothetical protein [Roseobacter denitrificans]|uniref:Uncharacterized protein n=1 Tax=Roseobacter denitrificans (strain ATCC 33942 / OCh 114) TaxID=375451 RepID=Q164A6_ROSDO|nr:hypothetical protein [Roseobacter denitrificans]ABG32687.1 hypothetical protein RD1_3181 [Roseobacter denitrificans OCh 114]SFF93736.1 hypothetical protein SAMN05443635_104106 [Roseobacter denitrificans OCh 114]